MATNYSLICWGGKSGFTATFDATSPHCNFSVETGIVRGLAIVFSTTDTLPPELNAGTVYYVGNINSNSFDVYTNKADSLLDGATGKIAITSAGTGTHTAISNFWNTMLPADRARYGTSGNERVFNGINELQSIRTSQITSNDVEYIEIGEAFRDIHSSSGDFKFNLGAAAVIMQSRINGQLTTAFHNGVVCKDRVNPSVDDGFIRTSLINYKDAMTVAQKRCLIEGLIFASPSATYALYLNTSISKVKNCMFTSLKGRAGSFSTIGLAEYGVANELYNNLTYDCNNGNYQVGYGGKATIWANNIVVNCDKGFYPGNQAKGTFINNVAVGNTINWDAAPALLEYASNNAGEATDTPWDTTGTAITTLTQDNNTFLDWAGQDYRPASNTSPLYDAGVEIYGLPKEDMVGDLRPSYNNGGAEAWDIGCYEFDNGFGLPPVQVNLVFTVIDIVTKNPIVGASVYIATTGSPAPENTEIVKTFTDAAGKVTVSNYNYVGDQNIYGRVRAIGYKTSQIQSTIANSDLNLTILMIQD